MIDKQTTRLQLDAADCQRTFSERRQARRRIVVPTEYVVTYKPESMQAGCEPAIVSRQVIDLTFDRAARVVSKGQSTGRTFLRSPFGSATSVIEYAG